jgi:hypothetical protein
MNHSFVWIHESFVRLDKTNHLFGYTNHLFVGTQDLCVQSNKTGSNIIGSNITIPIRMDTLDWTGRKDLASLKQMFCVPTKKCFSH